MPTYLWPYILSNYSNYRVFYDDNKIVFNGVRKAKMYQATANKLAGLGIYHTTKECWKNVQTRL